MRVKVFFYVFNEIVVYVRWNHPTLKCWPTVALAEKKLENHTPFFFVQCVHIAKEATKLPAGEANIRQQWGVVRHGTPPLKTEKSNNPPPKKSGGGGRYPPPTGSEKLGPPWRAERAENFFLFFYVVKKFLTTFFFNKRDYPLPTKPEPYPYHPYPPLSKFWTGGSNPPSTQPELADVCISVKIV